MVFKFRVDVDGVNVTSYVRPFEINESKDNNITNIKLEFLKTIDGVVILQQLKIIEIWRGEVTATDTKVFDGFITNVKTDGLKYTVTGGDKLYQGVNSLVNQIYALTSPQAGVISEIFLDLINTYTLLTADNTTVQNSGTVQILQKFKVKRKSVYDAAKQLSDTIAWQFYYRPDTNLVYFEPRGNTLNVNTLTVGGNVIALPKWEEDNSEYFNDCFVTGAPQAVSFTDSYTGDGSTTTFSMTKGKPIGVEVTVAGVIKKGGLTTATADAQYLIDAEAQTITFTTGNIPTGGQAILINYSYNIALAVHAYRQTSINKYGQTVSRPFTFSEIKTMADLKQKAEALLDNHTTPFLQTTLKIGSQFVTGLGLRVGQKIRVVDSKNLIEGASINRELIILSKKMRFPSDYDEISVGDKEWKLGDWETGVEERLQKLVDDANETEEILLEIVSLPHILRFKRSTISLTRNYINDSFIMDHDTNGIMYNSDETDIYSDFETLSDWTASGTASPTTSNDTTAGHYWVGTQGIKASWAAASGTVILTNTVTSKNNLSNVVGVASGTPTQGTAAFWNWTSDNPISTVSWAIGNNSSNFVQYNGSAFAQIMGASNSFALQNNTLSYVLFDLDSPASTTGTPTWSNPSYSVITANATKAGSITWDFGTLSKNNFIGLNGMGNRVTVRNQTTVTY